MVRNRKRPRIHRLEGGGVFLETPYDEVFLEQIKSLIPRGQRTWHEPPDAPAKGWRVTAEWADVGEHLTRSAFPGAMDEVRVGGEAITTTEEGKRLQQESLF